MEKIIPLASGFGNDYCFDEMWRVGRRKKCFIHDQLIDILKTGFEVKNGLLGEA